MSGIATPQPASLVAPETSIRVIERKRYVSRGGEKLDGALRIFDVQVAGRRWLDAGASTGGFTDRLLQGGAEAVVCVDVGYGQLDWSLRNDDRVFVMERTNIRDLPSEALPWRPDAAVADLSFISLRSVLPNLKRLVDASGDLILLVKPQFEVGRDKVGRGVVRDASLWRSALEGVTDAAAEVELGLVGVTASPLSGPAGNREFFVHLRAGVSSDVARLLTDMMEEMQ